MDFGADASGAGTGMDMAGDVGSVDGHDAHGHHGSTWLFGVLSFRTMVAALAFFGLGGLVAESLQQPSTVQVVVALAAGAAAMFVVHSVVRLFSRLNEDGTVRIQRAVGREATVYLTIPPQNSGSGKIHINLQDRLMEYAAVTPNGEKLSTGAKVMVIGVAGVDTLEVEPLREKVEAA
jgi:membrane protein implicated in regulation of membrane protease activity